MHQISDKVLDEALKKAKEIQLDDDFISILEEEVLKRKNKPVFYKLNE